MKTTDRFSPERQAREEALWAQPTQRALHHTHFTVPELPWKRVSDPNPGPPTDPPGLEIDEEDSS